jgi:uncharacterized protein (TIGR03000 family)
MLKKSLWGIALCTVASLGLLLTPDTSQAQRRGGGGGGRGGSWSGGRSWNGGNWNGGWNRGWDGNRGWNWGGFGAGVALGYGLGNWGYGGWGYPYYGGYSSGYSSYPYYGGYYSTPYYSYDNSYPAYTNGSPTYYDQSTYSTQQQQMGYYGAGNVQQPANPNAVNMTVFVPDPNAQIWFENHQTQQRGTVRQFESTVQPGQMYNFHIKARFMQNGQPVDVTRDVQGQAGQRVTVNFGNAQGGQSGAENLQQMPNNANVPLYGNGQQGYYGNNQFNTNPAVVPGNRQIENRSDTFNNQQTERNLNQQQTERNLNQGNQNNPATHPGQTGNQTPPNVNQNVPPNPNQGTGTNNPGTTNNPTPGTQGTNAGNNSQGGTQPGR